MVTFTARLSNPHSSPCPRVELVTFNFQPFGVDNPYIILIYEKGQPFVSHETLIAALIAILIMTLFECRAFRNQGPEVSGVLRS